MVKKDFKVAEISVRIIYQNKNLIFPGFSFEFKHGFPDVAYWTTYGVGLQILDSFLSGSTMRDKVENGFLINAVLITLIMQYQMESGKELECCIYKSKR